MHKHFDAGNAGQSVRVWLHTVACAATGNPANSLAGRAAVAGLDCSVFILDDLEQNKIIGSAISL